MLVTEFNTASNIKSRVNRQSVLNAITYAQYKLKTYSFIPKNGLIIYCGTVLLDNKEKKISIDMEPIKPITSFLYLCDNKFHTQVLNDMLINDKKYGYIIIDGQGFLLVSICGSEKHILHKCKIYLPKKHNKGGQSAVRFERLRREAYDNYIRKVCEVCTSVFITNDKINVDGLIIGGSSNIKDLFYGSNLLDSRLKKNIIKLFDIGYSFENGLEETIHLSKDIILDTRLVNEKNILSSFFNNLLNDNMVVFGLKDTIYALESGIIDKLIIWEDYNYYRLVLNDNIISYATEKEIVEKEINYLEKDLLVDWLIDNKLNFSLEIITNNTSEGNQFIHGFSGIGGILRYPVEIPNFDDNNNDNNNENNNNNDFNYNDFI